MGYDRQFWANDESQANEDALNHMEVGIKNAYNVPLISISNTAPDQCSTGDKYFNTISKKVFTATGTNTWSSEGETPLSDVTYVDFSQNLPYTYNGDTLVLLSNVYNLPVYPTPIIVCKSASDGGTLSIATAGAEALIPIILRNSCNATGYLTLENNKIKIGAGVNKVLVNCQLTLGRGPTGYASIVLKKNGNIVAFGRDYYVNWYAVTFTITTLLVDVEENDYFEIYLNGGIEGDYVINQGDNSCFITVEAIDVD